MKGLALILSSIMSILLVSFSIHEFSQAGNYTIEPISSNDLFGEEGAQ
ncbi:MAG: hypothetical protein OCC49_09945 [Fibrobacterales bacterium]